MSGRVSTLAQVDTVKADTALTVTDLCVDYETRDAVYRAVRDVTFTLRRGQKLGIVGESGCGKSTLALALLGLLEPPARITRGDVVLNGVSLLALGEGELDSIRGRDVALIFQDPMTSLDPVKRIGDQITEGIRRHQPELPRAQIRRRTIELLGEVEIPRPERRVEDYPHQFSGGMRQRALIAIALANNPSVIIADEPTTALDVTTQAQVLELIHRLASDHGAAVVLITHNLGIVAEFCDIVHAMYAGRIVESAPVHSLFRRQLHPYTEGLLAAIPRPEMRGNDLASIPGAPPSLAAIPTGCPFHPRCPVRQDICFRVVPPLEGVKSPDGLLTAECHFAADRYAEFSG